MTFFQTRDKGPAAALDAVVGCDGALNATCVGALEADAVCNGLDDNASTGDSLVFDAFAAGILVDGACVIDALSCCAVPAPTGSSADAAATRDEIVGRATTAEGEAEPIVTLVHVSAAAASAATAAVVEAAAAEAATN